MKRQLTLRLTVLATLAAPVLAGCPADTPADDNGDESTGTGTSGGMTAVSQTTLTPGPSDTTAGPPETDDTSTTTTTSTGEVSTSTGALEDCVDEDIGMSVGQAVSIGDSQGQGDDFDWDTCGGGSDTDGVGVDAGGGDSGGGFTTGGGDTGPSDTGVLDTGGKSGPGDDYVISWTPPSSGAYVIDLEGSLFDTVMAITAPSCGAEPIVCNDDCFELQSGVVYEATRGETVFIVVDGFAGRVGNFVVSITEGDALLCEFGGSGSGGGNDSDAGGGG
ncbi:MAG: hypothetical protein JKY37_34520 [Nannocystaceae bacterium]|nr:hypothetical protein [Nannocystaceae bacterium]